MALSRIHVVGIDHLVQYRNGIVPAAVLAEFEEFISRCAGMYSAGLIAEEFSSDALELYGVDESTARSVAKSIGIHHLYCDPDAGERARLGIPCFADLRELAARILGVPRNGPQDPHSVKKVAGAASDLDRSFWAIRERFWLRRLSGCGPTVALFICGHEHVSRFAELATEGGYAIRVENPFWREDIFRDYSRLGIA